MLRRGRLLFVGFSLLAAAVAGTASGYVVWGAGGPTEAAAQPDRAARSSSSSATAAVATACVPDWQETTVPNVQTGNSLLDLAVVGNSNVWAVGTWTNTALAGRTLADHWNGSTWSNVATPNGSNGNNYLSSVVAFAGTDIWAVGAATASGKHGDVVLRWDGSSWAQDTTVPNPSPTQNILYSIDGTSATDLWAVGEYDSVPPAGTVPLVLHRTAGGWTRVPTPSVGSGSSRFYDVTVVGPGDVWAVGTRSNAGAVNALVEHWNGTSWSVVRTPAIGQRNHYLWGVAAGSATDVWSVGQRDDANGSMKPQVLHWDGTRWNDVVPDASFATARLYAVDAVTATDVWFAGTYFNGAKNRPLILHWDGTAWAVSTPSATKNDNRQLHAIAEAPSGEVWAVGSRSGHSLAYHACF